MNAVVSEVDRSVLFSVLAAAHAAILPTRRFEGETARAVRDANRRELAQAVEALPAEDLAAVNRIAQLMLAFPDLVQDAIDYNADEDAGRVTRVPGIPDCDVDRVLRASERHLVRAMRAHNRRKRRVQARRAWRGV